MKSQSVELQLVIQNFHRDGKLSVRIEGAAGESLRFWKESNSWGAASWRVIVVRQGELKFFYQNPEQVFTRNFPSYTEHSGAATFDLDVNQSTWLTASSRPFDFRPGDIVVALYDVRPSPEAQKFHVWAGSLAAHKVFSED